MKYLPFLLITIASISCTKESQITTLQMNAYKTRGLTHGLQCIDSSKIYVVPIAYNSLTPDTSGLVHTLSKEPILTFGDSSNYYFYIGWKH